MKLILFRDQRPIDERVEVEAGHVSVGLYVCCHQDGECSSRDEVSVHRVTDTHLIAIYEAIGCALGKDVPEPKDEADPDRKGYSGLSLDQRTEFNALPPHLDDRTGVDCGSLCAKCNYLRTAFARFHPCGACGTRHEVPEEAR